MKWIYAIVVVLILAVIVFNGNRIETHKDCQINRMPINNEYHNYICLGIKSALNESTQIDYRANDTCYQYAKGEKCNGIQIPTLIFDMQVS